MTSAFIFQWLSMLAGAGAIVWFVRGLIAARQIDATRLLMLGWLSAYWLDPFLDFLKPMFTYNSHLFNRGCWCEFIPFWQTANGARIAEPLLVTKIQRFDAWPIALQSLSLGGGRPDQFPMYEFLTFPAAFVACALLLDTQDGHGLTAIEPSAAFARAGKWRATLRILAFVAFCNLCNLGYTTGMGLLALVSDPWPREMPSWLADEQCGDVTGIVCRR